MSLVKTKHDQAMDLSDKAEIQRLRGEHEEAESLFRQAFQLEREAALELIRVEPDLEPSRSILLRSAAALAVACSELKDAEELIALAFAGNPPDEIAGELRQLREQTQYEHRLQA